jgi:hypothetical protein
MSLSLLRAQRRTCKNGIPVAGALRQIAPRYASLLLNFEAKLKEVDRRHAAD